MLKSNNALGHILLDDVVNYHVEERKNDSASTSSTVFTIDTYQLINDRRQKKKEILQAENYAESSKVLEILKKTVKRRMPPHLLTKCPNNRVLLLINPFSGQKKAESLWEDYGREVLETAGIQTEIKRTESPGHAKAIMLSLDIDRYDAILVNSGDGLVTEVICGLLMRKDRKRALKLPISHIPGGTSNALAAAILFACNEPFSPRDVFVKECAVMVAIPRYIPLRLFQVETEFNGCKSMFMSANWGLVADIDIASERFRWAGMARLHVEAFIRLMQLPTVAKYSAKISYIPVNDKEISRKTTLRNTAKRIEFGKNHFKFEEISQATGQEEVLPNDFPTIESALNTPSLNVPSLTQPIDNQWVTVEGEWVMVNVTTLSHLGSDLPYMPSSRMGEPLLYLTLLDWATVKSRFHVTDLFIRMSQAVHLSYPCLQVIPVRAVRVEPVTKCGHFAIDGEPCQMGSAFQVLPSSLCATVIGRDEVQR